MPNPHEKAIKSAQTTTDKLGVLFDNLRAGNSPIARAYRVVIAALRGHLNDLAVVEDALATLREAVSAQARIELDGAIELGLEQALRDFEIYNLPPVFPDGPPTRDAQLAILGILDVQSGKARAIAASGLDEALALGDETRQGILRPAPIQRETAFWMTALSVTAYTSAMKSADEDFVRQAVAVVDGDTTDTCLAVHGQLVELDEDFKLTETPRFADEMSGPPFWHNCRTSVALIKRELLRDETTEEMRQEANEQKARPRPSAREGMARFRVVGRSVQEFRGGRWHTFERTRTQLEARKRAASLNMARRS